MSTLTKPVAPTRADAAVAHEAARRLASVPSGTHGTVRLRVDEPSAFDEPVAVPVAAFSLLLKVLDRMAKGKAVEVIDHDAEVTTGEMARLLNVSAPYAIKMLDEGKLPSRMVGTHRRARLVDVLAYRDEQYKARKAVLDTMARMDQELGLV